MEKTKYQVSEQTAKYLDAKRECETFYNAVCEAVAFHQGKDNVDGAMDAFNAKFCAMVEELDKMFEASIYDNLLEQGSTTI